MLTWLESQGHWGFIGAALVATLLLVLIDLVPPWLRERQIAREIAARARRQRQSPQRKQGEGS